MSEENVKVARRTYEAFNSAYKGGDLNDLLPLAKETWDPAIELRISAGFVARGEWRGHEGILKFMADQMEAFDELRIDPEGFIDAGDLLVVPGRLVGRARHTGIELQISFAHVIEVRDDMAVRIDVYPSQEEALEAAGLRDE